MKKSKVIISNHIFLFGFIIFIILWQVICSIFSISNYILPSPIDILNAFGDNFTIIISNSGVTLFETAIGLIFSIIIGIIISIIFNEYKFIKKMLYPYIIILQTIPLIAIAPLLANWFGIGIISKIILITLICSFPIITNLTLSFENINTDKLNYFRTLNTSKINLYRYLYANESIDSFFSAMKISITYSITGAILSEYVGAYSGLGILLSNSFDSFQIDLAFALICTISVLTLILIKINDLIYYKLK